MANFCGYALDTFIIPRGRDVTTVVFHHWQGQGALSQLAKLLLLMPELPEHIMSQMSQHLPIGGLWSFMSHGGRPIACVDCYPVVGTEGVGYAYVRHIAVLPEFRRRKVATHLLAGLEAAVKDLRRSPDIGFAHVLSMRTVIHPDLETAKGFFKSYGFCQTTSPDGPYVLSLPTGLFS